MTHEQNAVGAGFIEAEPHAQHSRVVGELPLQHLLDGGGLQDPLALVLTAAPDRLGELEHVRGRRRQRARRAEVRDDLVGLPGEAAILDRVGARHVPREFLRQGFDEAGVLHAQHVENVLLDILVETEPGDVGDDQACQHRGVVGIGGLRSRRVDPARLVALHRFTERHDPRRIVDDQVPQRPVFESRGMRQDVAQRDRLARPGVCDPEALEILVDVGVQVQLAAFDLLHHRNPGQQLRHRPGPEQGLVGIHRRTALEVLKAVAPGEYQLAVMGNCHGSSRALVAAHHRPGIAVDERLHCFAVPQVRGLHRDGPQEACREQQLGDAVREWIGLGRIRAVAPAEGPGSLTSCLPRLALPPSLGRILRPCAQVLPGGTRGQ